MHTGETRWWKQAKMSGIQHGEREMEEKDELTFIRKRNRSVQVFDEWKRKNEEECEKLAQ